MTTLTADSRVLVVGTGQAAFQLGSSLRAAGHHGPITLVGEEPGLPYQRPPLSKGYLQDAQHDDSVLLRGRTFYANKDITVRGRTRVVRVRRDVRDVVLGDGTTLGYDHLVLATGTRARALPVPGAGLRNVLSLRTLADAGTLRASLAGTADVVIIGGGFIGMEIAAHAARDGHRVTVVEGLDRPMARAVSPALSEHVVRQHRRHGVTVLVTTGVRSLYGEDGTVRGVVLADGTQLAADLVLVGIGAVANSELAADAGLEVCPVTGGVVVDGGLSTVDPNISAIGDCATYPSVHADVPVRLESVQNAVDHARHLAARLVSGADGGYDRVPWFWTTQFDMKIQLAGLPGRSTRDLVVGDLGSGAFSVLRFDDADRLVAVDSVNRPADHLAARKMLGVDKRPTPTDAARPDFELKAFAARSALSGG